MTAQPSVQIDDQFAPSGRFPPHDEQQIAGTKAGARPP